MAPSYLLSNGIKRYLKQEYATFLASYYPRHNQSLPCYNCKGPTDAIAAGNCVTCDLKHISLSSELNDNDHIRYLISSQTWRPLYHRIRTTWLMLGSELRTIHPYSDLHLAGRISRTQLGILSSKAREASNTDGGSAWYPGLACYQVIQSALKFYFHTNASDRMDICVSHLLNAYWCITKAHNLEQMDYQQSSIKQRTRREFSYYNKFIKV